MKNRIIPALAAPALLFAPGLLFAATLLFAAQTGFAQARHGLSSFGDLKYPESFKHFDYVNPDAPKGGTLRQWQLESFDNLNPLILKGVTAQSLALTQQSLMRRAADEPDAVYAEVAQSVELGPDRAWAAFTLDPRARWHDGSPITAEDVVFTFESTLKEGHPQYQLILADLDSVKAEGPRRVVFRFKPGETRRDLPLLVAQIPLLAKSWFKDRPFAQPTAEPPLTSGPYRIERVDAGRSLSFRRVADWWAKDLPANRGQFNFDTVRDDYYRDRDIAVEAFFAGEYDYRVEITARVWATGYDGKPAVKEGRIKREVLPDHTPSGVQAFFLNARKDKFKDARVREALNLAFDYEWMNKTLFYDLYKRTRSMFENSSMAATGLPSPAELALLEPYRAKLPPRVFTEEFNPPTTDGSGENRDNLRKATRLLREAGWSIKDKRLQNAKGEAFEIEFLLFEPSFQRILSPFMRNLERLGIHSTIRSVDVSAYEQRMRNFDYDIIMRRIVQPMTPGVEQRNFWSSPSANVTGSFNFSGIQDPAVDALVENLVAAKSRMDSVTAARALDRVLTWGWYVIPNWYSGTNKVAMWDRFGRPAKAPDFDLGLLETWWIDPAKDARLGLRR
ncbi:extracellular solute-binding protein [Ferrovibrio sp.]|uniref:extracellular solute-binding protein n=1 Tax=Ferrovibrio sp. TaxID=1917215 RepID=UPI0025B861D8|nr:extracellular solute-binding protein [Ferrovibrio sp.]MBX3455991.1 ABC transporter substrate-binding protein [Ferrovibrio sp.]